MFRLLASQVSVLGGGSGSSLPAGIVTSIAATRQTREFLIYWVALALAVAVLGADRAGCCARATAWRSRPSATTSWRRTATASTCTRIKVVVYIITAFGTAMIGALIFLQKLRISPDAAFSVNDWTAFVIFITVIGGIGRIEGPIVGTMVFFLLRQTLADLGTLYLLMLGVVAIVVMLWAPKGIWGLIVERFGWQVFPLERRVVLDDREAPRRCQRSAHRSSRREHPMPQHANKVIITCAITGSIHTPTMSDALPITPDQIATQAIDAAKAGAAILHLHARDPKDGRPSPDPDVFLQFLPRIKQAATPSSTSPPAAA